jgi:endonuclease/exonuclease/phosphatase (EEP) superfamily protein YafD
MKPATPAVQRLAIAVALLWAATIATFAALLWWPFDLLTSFRPHYAVLLLLASAPLIVRRNLLLAALALAGCAVNALAIQVPFGTVEARMPPVMEDPQPFRLVTVNVWFRNDDVARVADYLATTGADAVVLEEVSLATLRMIAERLPEFPYRFDAAVQDFTGAAVLSRHPIVSGTAFALTPGGYQAAEVRLAVAGHEITLIGAHLHWPVGRRVSQLRNEELATLARRAVAAGGPTLVAGDLNLTPWSPWFARLLAESGLADCAQGALRPTSWPAWLGPASLRIDYCLMSREFVAVATRRGSLVGSDHAPIEADLEFATLASGS